MVRGLKSQLDAQKLLESMNKARSKPAKAPEEPAVEVPVKKDKKPVKPKKTKAPKKDDYQSETLSKKEQRKLKKQQKEEEEEEEEEEVGGFIDDEAEEDEEDEDLDLNKLADSASESEIEDEEEEDEGDQSEEEEDEEGDQSEEDIPLSDVELDDDADVVPHTKLTVNNIPALRDSLARIELPWAKHSFIEHQSIVSEEKTELGIKDIYDDTQRELAFYKQGLDAVKQGRTNLLKLKVPFSRPMDYFAEMVKSDEHMDRLKNKLLTEAANNKASEEAKKQRNLKKFGKQVQHETLQQRAKQKKESLEKVKSLKKRKANNEFGNDDDFQIALEEATQEHNKRENKRQKPNGKRLAKDAKYGFGGKKRLSRENDAKSSGDMSGFSGKKMKQQRPGKSKRARR